MARRSFTVVDVAEILTHWYAGRSINEMSISLAVDRKTIRKYLAPAIAAGMVPGGKSLSPNEWSEHVGRWFPELIDTRLRQITWPEIDKHADYIRAQLAAGVRQSTVWQRLRDEKGLHASVASFRRWVAATVPEETRRAQVTVLRDEVPAGEEAQINYGLLGQWVDPKTGKRHRVWAFAIVLACSRHVLCSRRW
jgi:transposase